MSGLLIIMLLFSSCSVFKNNTQTLTKKEQLISKLSAKIASKRDFAVPIIKSLQMLMQSKDLDPSTMEGNLDEVEEFYNNPENTLIKIAEEDKGIDKLYLLEAIYDDQDTNTVSEKMGNVDPTMQLDFNQSLENNNVTTQSVTIQNVFSQSLKGKKLSTNYNFYSFEESGFHSNAIDTSFSKSNVDIYSGICLAALAGEIIYKNSWWPWIKVAGAALAITSYVAMGAALLYWQGEFLSWIKTDPTTGTLTGGCYPPKSDWLLQVIVSTGLPVGYAYIALPRDISYLQSLLTKSIASINECPFVKFILNILNPKIPIGNGYTLSSILIDLSNGIKFVLKITF
jgi:hypothetical protein